MHYKSGTALLLFLSRFARTIISTFKALVLPFVPNSNTEAHAVCINARLNTYYNYTHHGHLSFAMFWNAEFTRFL